MTLIVKNVDRGWLGKSKISLFPSIPRLKFPGKVCIKISFFFKMSKTRYITQSFFFLNFENEFSRSTCTGCRKVTITTTTLY